MGTAHAKYRIHALLLIRGSIHDSHHEIMVSKFVAEAHQKAFFSPFHR